MGRGGLFFAARSSREWLAGETNYFLGNDPARWRTRVAQFGKVVARSVVPGVDVLMLSGAAPLPFQVNVSTTAGTASAAVGISHRLDAWSGRGTLVARVLAVGFVVLFLVLVGARGFRVGRFPGRVVRFAEAFVIVAVLSVGLVACFGSGGGGTVTITGTPVGTYPLTVTGTTATGAVRTIGLTITVQ
jgi:hypothetical protein